MTTLEARDFKLVLRGLPRAVAVGQREGAVRGTTGDFFHVGEALGGTGHADNNHSVMEKRTVKARDRGFLAAVLGRGAGENAFHLPDQSSVPTGPRFGRQNYASAPPCCQSA